MIKNDNKRIAITLTTNEVKEIELFSKKLGVTKSVIIKLAITEYIRRAKTCI